MSVILEPTWTRTSRVQAKRLAKYTQVRGSAAKVAATTTQLIVEKYSTEGQRLWSAKYDNAVGISYDTALQTVVDSAGNVYVGGTVGASTDPNNHEDSEAVLLKYDTTGKLLWEYRYADPSRGGLVAVISFSNALQITDTGEVYLVITSFVLEGDPSGPRLFDTIQNAVVLDANGIVQRSFELANSKSLP